jgi:hypothetical protein
LCLSLAHKNRETADLSELCITVFTLQKGKIGQMKFTCRFSSFITGINTNMLLIFLFGLIAILASVSDGCDVGTTKLDNFDWNQVGVSVLIQILTHLPLKMVLAFIYY